MPKHPKPPHRKPAPCASITWKRASEIQVTASGYLRRGRGRVDLTLSLDARGGRLRGSLRLRDPGARRLVATTRFTRLRWLCQGLVVNGSVRAGRRLLPLMLGVTKSGRVLSFSVGIPALRYHVTGAVHGRSTLLVEKAAIHAATKGHTPSVARHGHARRKPAKGRPAHGP